MTEEKIKCLYYIKDLRTDKIIYIGQTIDFYKRIHAHYYDKRRTIDNYIITEGKENFIIEPFDIDVSDFSDDDMKNKEDELILQYNTINEGLNCYRSNKNKYNKKEYHNESMRKYSKTEKYKEWRKNYYKNNKEKINNYKKNKEI